MIWLRILYVTGMTNLSLEQIHRYEQLRKVNHKNSVTDNTKVYGGQHPKMGRPLRTRAIKNCSGQYSANRDINIYKPAASSKGKIEILSEAVALSLATFSPSKLAEIVEATSNDNIEAKKKGLLEVAILNHQNLSSTWRFYFVTALINYIILLTALIGTVASVIWKADVSLIYSLGTSSLLTILIAAIWKPHSKLLAVSTELNRVDTLTATIENLLESIGEIPEEQARAEMSLKAFDRISNVLSSSKITEHKK